MITVLRGGRVYDPRHHVDGVVKDIFLRDGRIIANPGGGRMDAVHDLSGMVVMAGGIDMHSHIAGGKMNIARILLPEEHACHTRARSRLTRSGSGEATMTSFATGYRYAEMGYTAAYEPAMLPVNARQTHLEMADIPILDKGAYAMLGNDDFFLRMLAKKAAPGMIKDYVAWTLNSTQALGIKVVNPGGISAFKFNQRRLDIDEKHPHYPVTPRQVLKALARAVDEIGLHHPLHVHGPNLGVPGNVESTLSMIDGAAGVPLHLTHIQYHSYGAEGDRGFSSGAARIAEAVNAHPNISVDVGQIMFGQTVTASGDSMSQFRNHPHAHPKKFVCMDIDCQAGCGLVPFRYRDKNFVNALQWAIGLEIFLLIDDPWRVFMTTDHPNGGPFTSYPHLIRLLMDKSFRDDMLATLNPAARRATHLASIQREYSLQEIAIMTRAGPARLLGLEDRGHLGVGAAADIAVYKDHDNKQKMFETPEFVFKDGRLIIRRGRLVDVAQGATHVVRPSYDRSIEKSLGRYFETYLGMSLASATVREDEFTPEQHFRPQKAACRNRIS